MVKVPARPKSQAITATPRVGPASVLALSTEGKGGRNGERRQRREKMQHLRGGGMIEATGNDCRCALVGRCRTMDSL